MAVLFTNNASTTLAASLNTSATAITVAAGQGVKFPSPTGSDYFYATLVDGSNNMEIVKCTARVNDILTVVRAQDGTAAHAYNIADKIELRPTAAALTDIQNFTVDTSKLVDGSVTNAKLGDAAVGTSKVADNTITTPKVADAAISAVKLAAGAALANLGFTPVQQGGGTNQGSNALKLGWSVSATLTIQVDSTLYNVMLERPEATPNSGGYRGLPPRSLGGNYTPLPADMGCMFYHSDGVARDIAVPNDATLAVDPGSAFVIVNGPGSGVTTLTPGAGVTLFWIGTSNTGARSLAAQGACTLTKVAANTWSVAGAGLS